MNRPLCKELRREYEAKGVNVVAAATGHSVQTHLAAYSPWCGDDVVHDAFARADRSHRRAATWNCRGGGSAGASCCMAPG
jgi:hypothetical protein